MLPQGLPASHVTPAIGGIPCPGGQVGRGPIESLRQQSSGKYLSASHPGVYEYNRNALDAEGASVPAHSNGCDLTHNLAVLRP